VTSSLSSDVYIAGVGLASCLGNNLTTALMQLENPPAPQFRKLNGLEKTIPYFAIPFTSRSWYERCTSLVRQVVHEANVNARHGGLYLASSSSCVGAIEANEPHAKNFQEFLIELARMIDWQGPVYWINTACTSGLTAIMAARHAIDKGCFDHALVLGLELENQLSLAGFAGMQLLSPDSVKPFAINRNGLVLGEAVAAVYVTKTPNQWRIASGAHLIDSTELSGASIKTYTAMLHKALSAANMASEQIDLIKVQAAGSIPNDAIEAHALNAVFYNLPPLLSLKQFLGHTLGAAGVAEIALLLSLINNQLWPNLLVSSSGTDPTLSLNLTQCHTKKIRNLLICHLGFGGSHACITLENRDEKMDPQNND
jgi:3-oxoacyl-[acyl-carrier-protein] synthase I